MIKDYLKKKKEMKESDIKIDDVKLENRNIILIDQQISNANNYIKFYSTKTENEREFNYWKSYKEYLEKFKKSEVLEKDVAHDARFNKNNGICGADKWLQQELEINRTGQYYLNEDKKDIEESIELKESKLDDAIIDFYFQSIQKNNKTSQQALKMTADRFDISEKEVRKILMKNDINLEEKDLKDKLINDILEGLENIEINENDGKVSLEEKDDDPNEDEDEDEKKESKQEIPTVNNMMIEKLLEQIGNLEVKHNINNEFKSRKKLKKLMKEDKEMGLNIVNQLLDIKLKENQLRLAKRLLDEKNYEELEK